MSPSDSTSSPEEHTPPPVVSWKNRILSFLVGQLALQVITAVTGFALVHWMSQAEYAKTSVAFSFQNIIGMLTDLGVSNCIIALSGERAHDPAVVGRYISAASALRGRMFWIMTVISVVAFPLVTRTQHWGFWTNCSLLCSVLITIYFQNWMAYQSALTINGKISQMYSIQVGSASGRFSISYLLHLIGANTGVVMAWVNAAATSVIAVFARRLGGRLIVQPSTPDPEAQREIIRYLSPSIPGIVFSAFQAQITILLITLFGKTHDIADMAVLGRLAQVFVLMTALNGAIIEPFFARLPVSSVPKRYLQVLVLAILGCVALTAFVAVFPQPVLWLIGMKYAHLRSELMWIVASSAISYVSGVLLTINSARKWFFWWYTFFYITIVLLAQAGCVVFLHLNRLHDVVLFSLYTSLAGAFAHFCGNIYGMVTGKTAT